MKSPGVASNVPLHFKTATEMLELLSTGSISAVELLEHHLAQMEKHNREVNAVVALDIEGAMKAAVEADNTPSSQRGALQGLPMTIKDSFEVIGMPTTCGLPALADHRPGRDADAVARLKKAGAVIYGKTNVPPGAMDWQSSNPVYGRTRNPWNLDRTPGGSSGGPAAALAAGFVPLELGSDIGGSIRAPAVFCGIYGHKPTHGVVPLLGHIPPAPGFHLDVEMGVAGPMARAAVDLELALDVIVAPSELQRPAWQVKIPPSRHERLSDFRVAFWADDRTFAVDSDCLSAMESWADDLRSLGVQIVNTARPDLDWHAAYETYLQTMFQLSGAGMTSDVLEAIINSVSSDTALEGDYHARMARAVKLKHCEYFNVLDQRNRIYRKWQSFFTDYDLLICPAMPTVSYPHDSKGDEATDPISAAAAKRMVVNGLPHPYFDGLQWPSVATVADLPATAVPIGRFVDGMPMGVQVIGPMYEDRTPIRFAQLVETALGRAPLPASFY